MPPGHTMHIRIHRFDKSLAAVIAPAPTTACIVSGGYTAAKQPSQQPDNNDQHYQCFKETAVAAAAKACVFFTARITPAKI